MTDGLAQSQRVGSLVERVSASDSTRPKENAPATVQDGGEARFKQSAIRLAADHALFRGEDHHHLAALELPVALDLGDVDDVDLDALEHLHAEILVGHLATAEAQATFTLSPSKKPCMAFIFTS